MSMTKKREQKERRVEREGGRERERERDEGVYYSPFTKAAKERHIDAPSSAGWRKTSGN